jgi:poly(A) polymerase
MRRHAAELARCAPARVLEETFKVLRCGNAARAFELARASGVLPVILPALAEALDAGDAAMRARFQAHLEALDALVRSGAEVSEAVLLGALLVHLRPGGEAGSRAPERGPAEGPADRLLAQLVQTARLPRRMAERTRLAMGAQRTILGPARRRRRRGGGLGAQAYFQDALQLLEISVRATGEGSEALERWKAEGPSHAAAWADGEERRGREGSHAHARGPRPGGEAEAGDIPAYREAGREAGPDEPSAAGEPGEDGAPRRRRRRRGGRRRRRRGAGAAAPSAGA